MKRRSFLSLAAGAVFAVSTNFIALKPLVMRTKVIVARCTVFNTKGRWVGSSSVVDGIAKITAQNLEQCHHIIVHSQEVDLELGKKPPPVQCLKPHATTYVDFTGWEGKRVEAGEELKISMMGIVDA